MALPKKGSRKIAVNGREYIWVASGNDGWIDLIICSAAGQGQKLLGQFDYHASRSANQDSEKQRLRITPGIVRQVIEYGLSQGWMPEQAAPDLQLRSLDDKIGLFLD